MLAEDDPRHGTMSGYRQGCREACCRAANREYIRAHRAGNARQREKDRRYAKARTLALAALCRRHPIEYSELLAEAHRQLRRQENCDV